MAFHLMYLAVPPDCVADVGDAVRGLALADAHVRDVLADEPVAADPGTTVALHPTDRDHIDPLALRRQRRQSDVRALQSGLLYSA